MICFEESATINFSLLFDKIMSVIGAPYVNSFTTSSFSIWHNIIFPSEEPEINVLPSFISIIETIYCK